MYDNSNKPINGRITQSMEEKDIKEIITLHITDRQLNDIEELREGYPEKIVLYQEQISQLESSLKNHLSTDKSLITKTKNYRSDLEENKGKIEKLNDQIYKVKTNKEYDALLNEIEHLKSDSDVKSKDLKEIESEKNDIDKTINEENDKLEDIKSKLSDCSDKLKIINKKIKSEEDKLVKDRKSQLKNISKDALDIYDKKRDEFGLAFSEVNRDACSNCYSSLPAQFIISAKNPNTLQSCPTCNIFLYCEDV